MSDANRLENFAKYAAIVSAIAAAIVGIGEYRRGVSQSIRELEWKQAEMARTIVNAMLNDEGWDAMTMLDWAEGCTYEIAPGTKVRILHPRSLPRLKWLCRRAGPSVRTHSDSSATATTVSFFW